MAIRIGVIGPGRVGQALARRWRESGLSLHGFLGTRREAAAAAVAFSGGGAVLDSLADLAPCHVVLVATPDAAVAAVAEQARRAAAVRRCALWLHAAGALGPEALAPLAQAGARTGVLHPLCPFPSAAAGHALVAGKVATIAAGGPRGLRLLHLLATRAGLRAVAVAAGDRPLYHAGCALAANGLTALRHAAERVFAAACGVSGEDAAQMADSLMQSALTASAELGSVAALTGPAARGEHATVAEAARRTAALDRDIGGAYAALAALALDMAVARGSLDAGTAARVRAALGGGGGG